ncbi:c-type cytochrome [Roseomonas frigidaquae]|uniref:C-type cytochrome n=1 Tax=Falsiroseomonas frigidaquae TaxID=487318 RepID=A0ABX1ESS5_9PROT|nr:c-type cytochrome [Falsiroseomonas frigidaquae]NKE43676.1 c-type cytochrome [Falsiroseomonas frigidaquae]
MIRGLVLLLALHGAALAQEGRAVFENHCASCHAVDRDAPEQAGPNLAGVIGRRIGGDPAFGYSPALDQAGKQAGAVWDRDRLLRFLADPEEMFPGTWMGANFLADAADRAAVADYLQSAR